MQSYAVQDQGWNQHPSDGAAPWVTDVAAGMADPLAGEYASAGIPFGVVAPEIAASGKDSSEQAVSGFSSGELSAMEWQSTAPEPVSLETGIFGADNY